MPINCIAIDDELSSLENIIACLNRLPALHLIKSFSDPIKALSEISSFDEEVDIIFMDIEMPTLSGIELATRLRAKTKYLIFTTAHTRYAIDAFSVNANAYLLKPYSMRNFTETIRNLYPDKQINEPTFDKDFFYVPLKDEIDTLVKIDFDDLIVLEQINEVIYFKTTKEEYVSFKVNFNKMLNTLKNHPAFIQVNTSTIISKLHIKSFLNDQIVLSGGTSISLTHQYKEAFLFFIKQNLLKNKLVNNI